MGSFELDIRSGELRSLAPDGPPDKVLLREQPLQVLRMLIERKGTIVTRGEIKKRLWPNDTIVDFDHSINVAIGVLRQVLGDSAANPRYIETLARRGYRLLVAVEGVESGPPAGEASVANNAPPLGDLTGRKVSHYRVLELLGGGGMGLVYRAEDLKLGRRAALKFLPPELAADPLALERLEREAQAASALNHPNICTIYDIEDYAGQPFIAMELLEGETLQQQLSARAPDPIPPIPLIDVAIQVCAALEVAHNKDIVHRDIKPANIFVTKQGTVKVLDFGVAKLVASKGVPKTSVAESEGGAFGLRMGIGLTRDGATPGTAAYMSPEQVRREELDRRSDLFSLGLVLYEMATGQRAFKGDTALLVQEAILASTPPAVESVNRAVPPVLAAVIARAIEKDRLRRYQTAVEIRHDLEQARAEFLHAQPHRFRRWILAAVTLLVVGAAATLFHLRRSAPVGLAPSDTIVLAHLANETGDRAFDEALYTALRVSLEQTPYLNVLADDKVRGTLADIYVDQGARITPEVALQVCRRTNSKLVVAPAIADAGNQLRLDLTGIDCASRSTVGQVTSQATSRDGVIGALGIAALRLRRELGEPESSVAMYNSPLPEATSSSIEALELLTLGYRRQLAGSSREAIAFYKRALQADPTLALAHAALSTAYGNVGEKVLSASAGRRAFDLRSRMTVPGRFNAESTYHRQVTGDWEESCAVLSRWVQAFPYDVIAHSNYSVSLRVLGQPDRALGEAREAARLLPAAHTYGSWVYQSVLADRLDEAQKTMNEALRRGFDSTLLRRMRALLAFLRSDAAAMQEQWTWAAGRADASSLFKAKAMAEAHQGRLRAALRSADRGDSMGGGTSEYAIELALVYAEVGLAPARPVTVTSNQTRATRLVGTLVLAETGHVKEARLAAEALRQDYPSDTVVQKYGLPLIAAAAMLRSNDAIGAVAALEPATKYDLASVDILPALYPPYIRGLAHLRAGESAKAEAEFRKVLAHPGLVVWGVIAPLARLQLARAQHATGDDAGALASYEVFLNLWRGADVDLPAYRDAKAEYARLRSRRSSE